MPLVEALPWNSKAHEGAPKEKEISWFLSVFFEPYSDGEARQALPWPRAPVVLTGLCGFPQVLCTRTTPGLCRRGTMPWSLEASSPTRGT